MMHLIGASAVAYKFLKFKNILMPSDLTTDARTRSNGKKQWFSPQIIC